MTLLRRKGPPPAATKQMKRRPQLGVLLCSAVSGPVQELFLREQSCFVTIIRVMSETMPLAAVKAHFSEVADRVEKQQERIVVTRNGRPAVVLISPDDLESLEETLAILSDKRLMAKVRRGLAEADAGDGIQLDDLLEDRRRR